MYWQYYFYCKFSATVLMLTCLLHLIASSAISDVFDYTCPSKIFDLYHCAISGILDEHAPIRTRYVPLSHSSTFPNACQQESDDLCSSFLHHFQGKLDALRGTFGDESTDSTCEHAQSIKTLNNFVDQPHLNAWNNTEIQFFFLAVGYRTNNPFETLYLCHFCSLSHLGKYVSSVCLFSSLSEDGCSNTYP